jgi:hypothetical protein
MLDIAWEHLRSEKMETFNRNWKDFIEICQSIGPLFCNRCELPPNRDLRETTRRKRLIWAGRAEGLRPKDRSMNNRETSF